MAVGAGDGVDAGAGVAAGVVAGAWPRALRGRAGRGALRLRRQVDGGLDLGPDAREEHRVARVADALDRDQAAARRPRSVGHADEALDVVEEVGEVEEVADELELERHGLESGRERPSAVVPSAVVVVAPPPTGSPPLAGRRLSVGGVHAGLLGRRACWSAVCAVLFAASAAVPGALCAGCAAGRPRACRSCRSPRCPRAASGRPSAAGGSPRARSPVAIFVKRMPVPSAARVELHEQAGHVDVGRDRLAEAHDLGVVGCEVGLRAGGLVAARPWRRRGAPPASPARLRGRGGLLALGREQQEPVAPRSRRSGRSRAGSCGRGRVEAHEPPPSEAGHACRTARGLVGGLGRAERDRQVELVERAAAV